MPKTPKSVEVNLLPGEDLETRPGGKFLKWALSWGKRIVIVTEGIVILAFLSRFWFDTVLADLTEQITTKKNVVAASANFEGKFREAAKRISDATANEKGPSVLTVYDKTWLLIPPEVTISQMAITSAGINLTGESSELPLAVLVANFRKSPNFTDLIVERLAKGAASETVTFSMKANYVWP